MLILNLFHEPHCIVVDAIDFSLLGEPLGSPYWPLINQIFTNLRFSSIIVDLSAILLGICTVLFYGYVILLSFLVLNAEKIHSLFYAHLCIFWNTNIDMIVSVSRSSHHIISVKWDIWKNIRYGWNLNLIGLELIPDLNRKFTQNTSLKLLCQAKMKFDCFILWGHNL